jgi:hypothetical protein
MWIISFHMRVLDFILKLSSHYCLTNLTFGSFFLLPVLNRACSKMKSAQWGFSFKKSHIHFSKQLCLYFNYLMVNV